MSDHAGYTIKDGLIEIARALDRLAAAAERRNELLEQSAAVPAPAPAAGQQVSRCVAAHCWDPVIPFSRHCRKHHANAGDGGP